MGQFCVLRQSVILVLDAVLSNIPIFSWRLDEVLSFLLVYWTTSDDEYLQRYHVPRFAYQTVASHYFDFGQLSPSHPKSKHDQYMGSNPN